MHIESDTGGGVRIALRPREALLLRTALERATFRDTPPELQGETFEFAEQLLAALARLPGAEGGRPA